MKPVIRAAHSCAPSPPRAATCCTKTVTGAVVCRLIGDMDPDSAPAAAQVLLSALDQAHGPHVLFVDLAEVRYFSAAGLTALLKVREAAIGARVRLVLVAPSPQVRRVLELTETRPLFTNVPRFQPGPTAS
ncbi:STAS domain-containing protein [Streptacidiphilus neutrinimicus]|uniref:STAS domain-containing protein n=1 Tax=Streptacidiphilus neutrinimicus TaxID=105420 RepID=UPI0006939A20|nr:STAS domain-containing protein [Streptacidiphilus neutrinimicus]